MVQVLPLRKSNGAPQHVGFESYIRIGKNQPLASGSLVSFLERMRLAEPARRKSDDMNNAKPRTQGGEIIQELARGSTGTVVNRHNFEMRIFNLRQRRECRRQFLLFIAGSKEDGNVRAVGVGRRCDVFDDRQAQRAVSDVESVENPERSDEPAENQSE